MKSDAKLNFFERHSTTLKAIGITIPIAGLITLWGDSAVVGILCIFSVLLSLAGNIAGRSAKKKLSAAATGEKQ